MCSGFPNGSWWTTNGIPISFKILPMVPMVIGNVNGTIDSPNGTIGANGKPMVPLVSHWLPMVPLVKLPMVQLGEPRTESSIMCPIKGRQSITMINGHFNPLYKEMYRSRFLLYSAICLGFCDGLHDNNTGKLKFPK